MAISTPSKDRKSTARPDRPAARRVASSLLAKYGKIGAFASDCVREPVNGAELGANPCSGFSKGRVNEALRGFLLAVGPAIGIATMAE